MGYAMAYACWARNNEIGCSGITWFVHFGAMQRVRDQRNALSACEGRSDV